MKSLINIQQENYSYCYDCIDDRLLKYRKGVFAEFLTEYNKYSFEMDSDPNFLYIGCDPAPGEDNDIVSLYNVNGREIKIFDDMHPEQQETLWQFQKDWEEMKRKLFFGD